MQHPTEFCPTTFEWALKHCGVYVQRKWDGVRCVLYPDGTALSRSGLPFELTLKPHPNRVLDGELIVPGADLNATCRAIKRAPETVQFVPFDVVDSIQRFSERVAGFGIIRREIKSKRELLEFKRHAEAEGWEGIIVRLDLPYKSGRNQTAMKLKFRRSAEWRVQAVNGSSALMEGGWKLPLPFAARKGDLLTVSYSFLSSSNKPQHAKAECNRSAH